MGLVIATATTLASTANPALAAEVESANMAAPEGAPEILPEGLPEARAALARLYGEPLFDFPADLYIPPDALEVCLEAFEGPLDLLLYLIRKQNFNILDIPLADVTRQYLIYVEQIRRHNLELAAEYLLMAAMLIEIKSRLLLPLKPRAPGQEPEDPRAELVRRLLDYERMKEAAQGLDRLPLAGRDFVVSQVVVDYAPQLRRPDVSIADLQQAWCEVLKRAKLTARHHISRESLSVREHMSLILRRLQSHRFIEFDDLWDPLIKKGASLPHIVVHFLAILELAREFLIEITQAEAFAPIYLRLSYRPQAVLEPVT